MYKLTPKQIQSMPYVSFMALLDEVNRPPGGKEAIQQSIINGFITDKSKVLDVGCNTGYCSFEIARIAKAKVTGVDISPEMIASARRFQKKDPIGKLIKFQVADGMKLPFKKDTFDVVFSGGSTAFIADKQRAIKEYRRVVKFWGFVIDINFFYHKNPPKQLLRRLNTLLGIDIKPWPLEYWKNLYKECDLECFYFLSDKVALVSRETIRNYSHSLSQYKKYSSSVEDAICKRLIKTMSLFNENHRYLSYGIFINRKRASKEQITLF